MAWEDPHAVSQGALPENIGLPERSQASLKTAAYNIVALFFYLVILRAVPCHSERSEESVVQILTR